MNVIAAGADVHAATSSGTTSLMLAAASGDPAMVAGLLDAGADPNAKDKAQGQTALMFAAARDRADAARVLLARGADANAASAFVDLLALGGLDDEGRRVQAMPSGSQRGGPRPVDVPGVTRGFRYNELIGKQGGLSALHFAARQGHVATARVLVDAGANVNMTSPADRTSPLLIAIINGHFDLAMYLLEHGADPRLASDAGATPLYAVLNVQWAPKAAYPQPRAYLQQQHSYLEVIESLVAHGADPNVRVNRKIWYTSYNFDQSSMDEIGATPFWRAAYAATSRR